jgi:hypothetical protein
MVVARVVGGATAAMGMEEVLGGRKQVVCLGVEALRDELLLDARVPEVLDLVVRAPREVLGDLRPPAMPWIMRSTSGVNSIVSEFQPSTKVNNSFRHMY